jgi:hypothetical protein
LQWDVLLGSIVVLELVEEDSVEDQGSVSTVRGAGGLHASDEEWLIELESVLLVAEMQCPIVRELLAVS